MYRFPFFHSLLDVRWLKSSKGGIQGLQQWAFHYSKILAVKSTSSQTQERRYFFKESNRQCSGCNELNVDGDRWCVFLWGWSGGALFFILTSQHILSMLTTASDQSSQSQAKKASVSCSASPFLSQMAFRIHPEFTVFLPQMYVHLKRKTNPAFCTVVQSLPTRNQNLQNDE